MRYFNHRHQELKEGITEALEFEAAKSSSRQMRNFMWAMTEKKKDNTVIEALKKL